MAYTVNDVAKKTLSKLGVLRAGGEPRAADAASVLDSLKSLYLEYINNGGFGRIWNVPLSNAGTVTAGGNQHLNKLTDETITIDLPSVLPACHFETWRPCRDYGWGLNVPVGGDPGFNVPRDRMVVMITGEEPDNSRATYLYDGTIQRWLRIDTLALSDEAPLSARGMDGLASLLAERLSDEFGTTLLSPSTMKAANRYRLALVTRYGQAEDCFC